MPETQKYFILSDFHLEFYQGKEEKFWKDFPYSNETKTCICAGDFTSLGLPDAIVYKHFSKLVQAFDKVIYVPGNHEYYGSNPTTVADKLKKLKEYFGFSIDILQSGHPVIHNGQRFLGDTMWFPDTPGVHVYRKLINDGAQIKELFPWAFEQSQKFMSFLKEEVRENDIVISHHVPNDIDTLPHWRNSSTQSYFLNVDCHRYFLNPNNKVPKAWIYGHTHDYHDYQLGNTRFICNPIGYSSENPNWRSRQLVYEL